MKPVHTFTVIPKLPDSLERLRELAHNLRWSWNHDTIALFRRLDSGLWEKSGHNPVQMLGTINQKQLEEAAADDSFIAHFERVISEYDAYMEHKTSWFRKAHKQQDGSLVAYFSAEFGLTECLSIFAGGLGILVSLIGQDPINYAATVLGPKPKPQAIWECPSSGLDCFISKAISNSI